MKTIILQGVEYKMAFNMNSIKAVMNYQGMGFNDVVKIAASQKDDFSKIAEILDFCLVCAMCGINEQHEIEGNEHPKFKKIREIGALVKSADEIIPAFSAFIEAFMGFYQIDTEENAEIKKSMAMLNAH